MCTGPRKPSQPASPPSVLAVKDGGSKEGVTAVIASPLLELAASDDVTGFKKAVEEEGGGTCLETAAPWYGRAVGGGRWVALELRTPLQVAALYGSTEVVGYILAAIPAVEVNRSCGSDGAAALHLAAAGGASSCVDTVRALVAKGADVDVLDASGNRAGDLIPKQTPLPTLRALEALLKASVPRSPSPEKKKEYPPDLTLPDLKTGVYCTDEFRMYSFKIKPCSRAYSHDWTECPFAHPGENARRRDPRKYLYSCVPCPEFRKGTCRSGDTCEYAHGVFESWLHPAQYRTRLCKDEIGCTRRVCFFAHKSDELRTVNPSLISAGAGGGLGVSSPRSPSPLGLSQLDMAAAAAAMMMGGGPMSPSSSSPAMRMKPHLIGGRNLELELSGLDGLRQKLIEEISAASGGSPRFNWSPNSATMASKISDFGDLVGSQFQGLSVKQTAAISHGSPAQSPRNQQFLSGYGGKLPSSPSFIPGLDHHSLTAAAIMNSRSPVAAKRGGSFASARVPASASSNLSSWGSPGGKLDWGIHMEELNDLRMSSSTAIIGGGEDEPDVSWVQFLVKDGPATASGGDFASTEPLPAWA